MNEDMTEGMPEWSTEIERPEARLSWAETVIMQLSARLDLAEAYIMKLNARLVECEKRGVIHDRTKQSI